MSWCNECGRTAAVVLSVAPGWGENAFCDEHNPENPLRPLYVKAALWDTAEPLLRSSLLVLELIAQSSHPLVNDIRALLARSVDKQAGT